MNQIASSNFNPKEISADNSPYVADLGIKLDGLKNILDRIDRNLSISDEIRKSIWVSLRVRLPVGHLPDQPRNHKISYKVWRINSKIFSRKR